MPKNVIKTPLPHTLVSRCAHPPPQPPKQPPLEIDDPDMTQNSPIELGQSDCFDMHVPRPQAQTNPAQAATPDSYPSTPGTSATMTTISLSSPRTVSNFFRAESPGAHIPFAFVATVFQDIKRAVENVSRSVSEMCPCFSCILVQATHAAHFFIRGLELVADGMTMYDEMCYEGFDYIILLRQRIQESVRYVEEAGDRNV